MAEIKNRSPIMVILLSCCTFGLYAIYWLVKTKEEINSMGGEIPTAWLLLIFPYFYYKYAEAFAKVVKKDEKGIMYFLLLMFLSPVGMFIVQTELNKYANC